MLFVIGMIYWKSKFYLVISLSIKVISLFLMFYSDILKIIIVWFRELNL